MFKWLKKFLEFLAGDEPKDRQFFDGLDDGDEHEELK